MFRTCAIFAKARNRKSDTVPEHRSSDWKSGKCAAKVAAEYVLIKKGSHVKTTFLELSASFLNLQLKSLF